MNATRRSTDQPDDLAREGIRSTVVAWSRGAGRGFRRAGPWAIVGALVAGAIAPVVWPLAGAAGVSAVLGALVGQVGSVGSGYLVEVVTKALDRARQAGAGESSPAQLREAIEDELRALTSDDEGALGLRREMAALLRAVGGIDIAVSAAVQTGVEEVQQALFAAVTDLGAEFGWMLAQTRQTLIKVQDEQGRQGVEQRHQTDLARENLVKTNLVIQRLELLIGIPSREPTAEETTGPVDPASEEPAAGPCPYMGLRSFRAEDAQWFFGRERLTADLVARLVEAPLLAVVGASGSGKSSLLGAGLLPAAWAGTVPGASNWITVTLTPTSHPLEELASRVALLRGLAAGGMLADLRSDPRNLRLAVRQTLADAPAEARLLMIIDQLEEIFTLCSDNTERQNFLDALAAIGADPGCGATVVLGIRADFYPRCADYPPLATALQDHQLLVTPMTTEELREAMSRPAIRASLCLEPGLVETILADLGDEPGSLPLLSHALSATWERRRGRTLTCAGYRDAGGVRQAIGQTADTVYTRLTPVQRAIAKDIFLRLTALGEGTEDTRRRAPGTELLSGSQTAQVQDVLNALASARLITLGEDSVEVAHEALIREWPRLRGWLDEDRDGLRLARGLTTAAHDWTMSGRDEGILYRGARLADTRAWVQRAQPRLSEVEAEFLTTSIRTQEQQEQATQRRTRRLRQLVGALTTLLVLAVSTTIFAITEQRTAIHERDLALSREVADEAAKVGSFDTSLAMQLNLAAYRIAPTIEARSALLRASTLHTATRELADTDSFRAEAISPDGRTLAVGSADQAIRLYNITNPRAPTFLSILTDHTDTVLAVAFSPDGHTLASASFDHTVRIWDLTDLHHPTAAATLTGYNGGINAVAFSPDGHILATGGGFATTRVWDVSDPHHPIAVATLTGLTGTVYTVAFSPDGHTLATSDDTRAIQLWNLANLHHPVQEANLTGHSGAINAVAFSPDGHTLASGSDDATARLWDLSDPHQPSTILTGHAYSINAVAFSPDGHTLATGSNDDMVRLWDLTDPHHPSALPILTDHAGPVRGVAFSRDGHTLATGSDDATARLWDLTDPHHPTPASVLTTLTGPVYTGPAFLGPFLAVAFSPDGHTLAAGNNSTAPLWDLTDSHHPSALPTLTGHTDTVYAVAFSPDGHTLATGGNDNMVRLWDLTDPHHPSALPTLTGHTGAIDTVAFSPHGHTLATGSYDATARLWDLTDLHHPTTTAILTSHANSVNAVAFSPDGHTLATGHYDGMVRLWNLSDTRHPTLEAPFTGTPQGIRAVAFSPDGHTLATGSFDATARLWDLTDLHHPTTAATLTGHTDTVYAVAFSPDGYTLATGSKDGTVRLWDTNPDQAAKDICSLVRIPITPDQWQQYIPDLPYQPPCP